ncbi:MAG: HD domain-containing protein [Gemmatimonadota bacterium]
MASNGGVISGDDSAGPLAPLAFCGSVPWPLISELSDGDEIVACYVVRERRRLQTKSNQAYLRLVLGDRTGTIDGMIWDEVERWEPICVPSEFVGVRASVSLYREKPQLKVTSIEPVRPAPADLSYLLPTSPRDRELMERELDAHIASVRDRPLRALLRRCLGRETDLGGAFREHPAATRNHHAYVSGLLEHTLSVTSICERLVEHYREQGVHLDRDLLITGALLHDLGKVQELAGHPAPAYTTRGRLLGHIVLGIEIVGREGAKVAGIDPERLLIVQHLIASHQGKPEWDSPRVPQLQEALVLHYADDLDAKMNQAGGTLAGVEPGEWSDYDRSLGRSLYAPPRAGEAGRGGGGDGEDSVIDLFRG